MDLIVRTYDPKLVTISFGANILNSGIADGTFISITSDDGFEVARGSDGSVDRTNKNADNVRIEVTLKQTSPVNTALSIIHETDKRLNTGVFPFLAKDVRGDTVVSAAQSWIVKRADSEYSNSMSTRTWTFDTGPAIYNMGGNI
jgi:hypothetical protein